MPSSPWMRRLACWLFSALLFVGCAGDTTTGETGKLKILLELANGVEIDEVTYAIGGNDMDPPMMGTINTSAPSSTASFEVYGLPPGKGYTILLTAVSTDGETTCTGDAEFDVEPRMVTDVMMMLNCKAAEELGGVRVTGKPNFCSELLEVVVWPLETSIGNPIHVRAEAFDEEDDPIEYLWTGTGGSFADPTIPETTYICEQVGEHTITITVSDDGFDFCDCDWTVDVECVDGTGGGGMGGAAGAGGEGGTGGVGGEGGTGGMAGAGGAGGMAGMGGEGGTGGMAGTGGEGGTGGVGGEGGTGGMGGMAGAGGAGGTGGTGGIGGMAGMGGAGGTGGAICIPDGDARDAGTDTSGRACGCPAMSVCLDGTCVPSGLVFVSSTKSDAALGGPRGADQICADLAREANLGGYWMSWTSDPCTSPLERFEKSTLPYRMWDGTQVSTSWARMTGPPPPGEGYLDTPINRDETGTLVDPDETCFTPASNPPVGCFTWTNTSPQGATEAIGNNNGCLGLTTNNSIFSSSASGKITSISKGWTDGTNWNCGIDNLRIYCFEQSEADPDPSLP